VIQISARQATVRALRRGLANPKVDDCEVAQDLFVMDPGLLANRPGRAILGDKGYGTDNSAELGGFSAAEGAQLMWRANRGKAPRPGARI
jgi:hypothetical protein